MPATITATTRARAFACGCAATYEGPLGACASMAECERHMPAWKREGFTPAATAPAGAEGWEELFLATYAEVSKGWPL